MKKETLEEQVKHLSAVLKGLLNSAVFFEKHLPEGEYLGLGDLRFWVRDARAVLMTLEEAK